MQFGGQRERTTTGLATVAMLKVNFDNGLDHIAMFEPFVLDAIRDATSGDFSADDIRATIIARHELRIPINTLTTLLKRSVRTGLVRREGGRYFRTEATVEVAQIGSVEDALGAILDFLQSYHVAMALDEDAIPQRAE